MRFAICLITLQQCYHIGIKPGAIMKNSLLALFLVFMVSPTFASEWKKVGEIEVANDWSDYASLSQDQRYIVHVKTESLSSPIKQEVQIIEAKTGTLFFTKKLVGRPLQELAVSADNSQVLIVTLSASSASKARTFELVDIKSGAKKSINKIDVQNFYFDSNELIVWIKNGNGEVVQHDFKSMKSNSFQWDDVLENIYFSNDQHYRLTSDEDDFTKLTLWAWPASKLIMTFKSENLTNSLDYDLEILNGTTLVFLETRSRKIVEILDLKTKKSILSSPGGHVLSFGTDNSSIAVIINNSKKTYDIFDLKRNAFATGGSIQQPIYSAFVESGSNLLFTEIDKSGEFDLKAQITKYDDLSCGGILTINKYGKILACRSSDSFSWWQKK